MRLIVAGARRRDRSRLRLCRSDGWVVADRLEGCHQSQGL